MGSKLKFGDMNTLPLVTFRGGPADGGKWRLWPDDIKSQDTVDKVLALYETVTVMGTTYVLREDERSRAKKKPWVFVPEDEQELALPKPKKEKKK